MCGRFALKAPPAELVTRFWLDIGPEHSREWLAEPAEKIEQLVVPYPAEEMQAWPVSRRVSKTGSDDAELIVPD